jgi:hypothetical protein
MISSLAGARVGKGRNSLALIFQLHEHLRFANNSEHSYLPEIYDVDIVPARL